MITACQLRDAIAQVNDDGTQERLQDLGVHPADAEHERWPVAEALEPSIAELIATGATLDHVTSLINDRLQLVLAAALHLGVHLQAQDLEDLAALFDEHTDANDPDFHAHYEAYLQDAAGDYKPAERVARALADQKCKLVDPDSKLHETVARELLADYMDVALHAYAAGARAQRRHTP